MTVDEFYKQECNEKPLKESCFAGVVGVNYKYPYEGEIFSSEELKAFAEAYHKVKLKYLGTDDVIKMETKELR